MSLAGFLGRSVARRGGQRARYGARLVVGKVKMNDGPMDDAGSFTMESQARTRERGCGHVWVMGGRVGGCLGLFPGVCCPKLPHASPTIASSTLQRQRIARGRHRGRVGLLLQVGQGRI